MKNFKRKSYALLLGLILCLFGTFVACKEESPTSDSAISSSLSGIVNSSHSSQSISESITQESEESSFLSSSVVSSDSSESPNSVSSKDESSQAESTQSSISSDSSEDSSESSLDSLDSSVLSAEEESSSEESAHVHEYEESVYKEATCEEKGVMLKECKGCSYYTTEDIPALGHEEVVDVGVPSTCKEQGKTEGSHCSRCNTTLVAQEYLPLVEHTYENHVCKWCQRSSLLFDLHKSREYYVCTGSVEACIRYLKIPAQYNGIPVKEIAENAFACRFELIYVELPETIEYIGTNAFADCYNIIEVCNKSEHIDPSKIFEHGNLFVTSPYVYNETDKTRISTDEDGFITYTNEDGKVFMIGYCGTKTELTIPEYIDEIQPRVLGTIQGLKSVVISANIEYLRSLTFTNCLQLEKIVIGAGVKEIEPYFFGTEAVELISQNLDEVTFEETEGWLIVNQINTKIPSSVFENFAMLFDYLFEEYSGYTWIRQE